MAGWGMYYLLQKEVCPLSREVKIGTTKIYTKGLFFYKIMPSSRNVNHDKMSACHQGREGYTDYNVGQTWSVDYH